MIPSPKRPRVLISHQGCVPIYRRAFYERLARSTAVEYVVAVGEPPRGTDYILAPQPYTFQTQHIKPREFSLGSKTLIWQPLAAPYWSSFDAVVLGEELKFVSHLAVAAISKLRGRPLLGGGFGAPPANVGVEQAPSRHPAAEFVTRQLRSLSDGYLCYTDGGKDALAAQGYDPDHIAVLGNTVDMEQQSGLRAAVANESDDDIRKHFGLPADRPVLLYFGRFLPAKQIDVLIRYVQSRRDSAHPVSVLIFGDGVDKQKLLALAGDASDIVFRTHDDLDLSRALKVAISI
ncbi:MAG TPA: glycosyltransferase, partial [Verrucomicrobiae bacterium]|nr:glycosyltransferase [Verrucomicrobiae bacterium]